MIYFFDLLAGFIVLINPRLPLEYSTARFSLVSHSSVQPSRRGVDMQLILVPRYIYGPSQSGIPDVIYHPSIHSLLLLLPPKTPLTLPSIPNRATLHASRSPTLPSKFLSQQIHNDHTHNRQTAKHDQDLISIIVLWRIICWKCSEWEPGIPCI